MSEDSIVSTETQTSMSHNVPCAQENEPVLHVTPESTTTSPMSHPDAQVSHAAHTSAVTADEPETCDDVPQVEDLCDVMHLSPKMHQALDLLFAGHSAVSVARQIGVHPHTIACWQTNHAAFIAAYNRRRAQKADELSRRITGLLDTALTNVERHVAATKKKIVKRRRFFDLRQSPKSAI